MKNKRNYSAFNLIAIYLLAIVTANVIVNKYGPGVSVLTAFIFIGLNITTRDYLHEIWAKDQLKRNMFFLIACGSIISIFFNAGKIAFASFTAFAISETVDAVCYQYFMKRKKPKWLRVNGSNVFSSIVDSFLFPTIAFGSIMPAIVFGQIVAKIGGGFIWWFVLRKQQ